MLLAIISIGHLCVFLYCIVCFNVLIQLLAATVNKWCYYYSYYQHRGVDLEMN